MDWQFGASSLTYFLTAAVTFGAAWVNWRRAERTVRPLALAMFFISVWACAGGLELASMSLNARLFWVILANLASGTFVNFLLIFVLEYYGLSRGFRSAWYALLWIPMAALVVVEVTNPLHHLMWTGFTPGPAGSGALSYQHGPAYYLSVAYIVVLVVISLGLLIGQAFRSQGRKRFQAIWMNVSLSLPFAASLAYAAWSNNALSADLLPVSFAVCGLFVSWIVFEDLQYQVADRTRELQAGVQALEREIENRRALEGTLREAQDVLAERLSDQSQKLSGFYDLILISSRPLEPDELLKRSLEKIAMMLGCEAVCFYQPSQGGLHLEAFHGLLPSEAESLQTLPEDWPPSGRDVRADVNMAEAASLPENFGQAGCGAGMHKRVHVQDRLLGMLSALWRQPRRFSVDEIVLFGTLTDQMGIILENARLRQQIASTAMLQERRRLARDLHDSVTQSLHSLVLSSETAAELLHRRPDQLEETLAHLGASARHALKEMRLLLYELRLVPLEEIPLVEALKNRLDAVERRAGVRVDFQVGERAAWPRAWEVELYPIAMEALNNALKHAAAKRVEVQLSSDESGFLMSIADDGRGFDPQNVSAGGMGLYNMAERAGRLNGRLEVHSTPGQGTRVCLRIGNG